jgi:hypothetical protein
MKSDSVTVNVTIVPVESVQGMIKYLREVNLPDRREDRLHPDLEIAQDLFRRHRIERGVSSLEAFIDTAERISKVSEPQTADQLARLIGQAKTINGCEALVR